MKKIKMTQLAVALTFVTLGLTVPYALGVAHALTTISFHLAPASAGAAKCLQDATGAVTVLHKEDTLGVDTLHLDARGLPADTDFAVFLTSADAFASPSFGTVEYIGDFTTNAAGIGSLKVDAIIAEAFVSTPITPRVRQTWTTWSSGSPIRLKSLRALTLVDLLPSMAMGWPDPPRCPRRGTQGLNNSRNNC